MEFMLFSVLYTHGMMRNVTYGTLTSQVYKILERMK